MVLLRFHFWQWAAPLAIVPALLFASDNADVLEKCQFLAGGHYSYYKTDYFWNKSGDKVKSFNDFRRFKGEFCAIFGVSNRDTLHLQGSYSKIDESANGNTTGFGDVELSWKHYFGYAYKHFFTGRLQAIIPVGGRKYSLRYGRWGGEADLFIKREMCCYGKPLWYNFGAGYRKYDGYPSDQVRGFFEGGFTPFRCFSILVDSQLKYGVYNGKQNDPPNLILYNSNYRLWRGSLYGVLNVWRSVYIYGGGFRHLWGRNVGTGGGFFVGSYFSF